MKSKVHSFLATTALLVGSATCAVAQTPKNYSWSGTSMTPPALYSVDSNGNPPPTYQMANNRLHAASPGAVGSWVGKQFDWPCSSLLGDNEKISGSVTFRINSLTNTDMGQRFRVFVFNTGYSNGMPAALLLYAASYRANRDDWYPGGSGDWNNWEMNSANSFCPAPAGKTYLYNSFNQKNPATDTDYCRLIDNGVDHVFSWSAQYDAANNVVNVQTWVDGVSWTITAIGMQYPNWYRDCGWTENSIAKAWPGMGAWDIEYSEIHWSTTAATSDIKNYWWTGTSGGYPTLYSVDSNGNPPPTYTNYWKPGRLNAASPGALTVWSGKQFDWPCSSLLGDNEKISGSVTFRINSLTNTDLGQRFRLLAFNSGYSNGLPVGILLYAASYKGSTGNWFPGPAGSGDWNNWEMNANQSLGAAPAGKTYLYNSFNQKNPATDTDYCRLIDNGVDHVFSWSAQYDAANNVVNVQTWVDGVSWTITAIGMQYPNWYRDCGWTENSIAKAWPNMGAWDVEYSELRWSTTAATSDVKNYWWTGTSGGYPTLYSVDSNGNPPPTYTNYWKPGRLNAASPGALTVWSGKQFDWPCPGSALADEEMLSGSVTFRINSLTNIVVGDRLRLFGLIVPWKNGLNGIVHLMAASYRASRNNWKAGGDSDWNKWEMNSTVDLGPAPAGQTFLYNAFNMDDPATNPDYCRAVSNGVDHVLSWTMQYLADRVQVALTLDGAFWTVTDVGRQSPNWFLDCGFAENAMSKAWPNMGAYDVEWSEMRWATTKAVPNVAFSHYPWPTSVQWELRWWGTLLEATDINGPWSPAVGASPLTPTFSGPRKFYRAQGLQCP